MLVVTNAARRMLAQPGWDPVYGARPLKRAIQRLVQDALALMLLEGKFSDGDTLTVDAQGGDVTFTRAAAVTPAAAAS
jgi:ATP-dependent Clp protease ATP-binding subunit ClpB